MEKDKEEGRAAGAVMREPVSGRQGRERGYRQEHRIDAAVRLAESVPPMNAGFLAFM